jgi:hypothetical protein
MIQEQFKMMHSYNSVKQLIMDNLHLKHIIYTFLKVNAAFKTQS